MHRRCIICGQEPGDQFVYPRNISEARRWQNWANLSAFDVDTETLCRYGCVCSSHLNVGQRSSSDLGTSSGAGEGLRTPGGLQRAKRPCSVKWSSSGSGSDPPKLRSGQNYPTNNKAFEEVYNESDQSLSSMNKETSNVNRCQNGFCRFQSACNNMLNNNMGSRNACTYTPRSNLTGKRPSKPIIISKLSQPQKGEECAFDCPVIGNMGTRTYPERCFCSFYPGLRTTNTEASPQIFCCRHCPVLSQQKVITAQENKTSRNGQQKTRYCDRACCPDVRNQRAEDSSSMADDFSNITSILNGEAAQARGNKGNTTMQINNQQSRSPNSEQKSKCCQAIFKCQLKDQEVQCSKLTLAESQSQSSEPISRSKAASSLSYRTSSLGTSLSAGHKTNSSNFSYAGDRKHSNAINVLLMNGNRNDFDDSCCCTPKLRPSGPPPAICVQESDLTGSDEQVVYPNIDKPNYRVCQPATADRNETNVLVLEEGPMDGCCPKTAGEGNSATGEGQDQNKGESTSDPNQSRNWQDRFGDNWLDNPATANYTKLLEMQRARIKELETLLQQHNQLQQTIQHKVAELQCTDQPVLKDENKT
ncbi:uncharacterized protein LOC108097907 [Drosophila ficusphila]|uniref:uncharacterized protein LOC108097907 n=1 Tax=Drosophila ficusphila TaxID=30025 RepID=UPI0007E691A5|nr:uncharacterized protein LOC108097907 [Drosophila ficusphila]